MLYKLLPLPLKVSLDYVMLVNLSARHVTKPFLKLKKIKFQAANIVFTLARYAKMLTN